MKITAVILGYLGWHYSRALRSLSQIWKNFLDFVYSFFSITALFRNFFDPWKRMADSYPKHFSLKAYLFTSIANIITRLVGIIVRAFFIIVGLTVYILTALLYPIALIIWFLLPVIILTLLVMGLYLIIK